MPNFALSVQAHNMPLTPPTQPHKNAHTLIYTHTHSQKKMWRECRKTIMRTSTFEKNNLPQLGGEWTLACCISCHRVTRASRCPQPIQSLNNSLHSPKVPAGFPGSLPSTLWRGFEPGKGKTMHNGPSSTTHDPVMNRERNMGEEGDEREKGGRVDVQAFSLRTEGWWQKVRGAC